MLGKTVYVFHNNISYILALKTPWFSYENVSLQYHCEEHLLQNKLLQSHWPGAVWCSPCMYMTFSATENEMRWHSLFTTMLVNNFSRIFVKCFICLSGETPKRPREGFPFAAANAGKDEDTPEKRRWRLLWQEQHREQQREDAENKAGARGVDDERSSEQPAEIRSHRLVREVPAE